ncbi:hypothetical protein [Limnohabitans sp.]|jgi:hypothetical protein|uniref:hypothetical protein n=1 Tax=Limnohabitans sp. TaxID=1907725 RepID=UPI0037BE3FE7
MVQFPMPFGAKKLKMCFAGADAGRDVVSCTRAAFSFGIILSIQVKRVLVVALCLLVGAVFGHVKRA